MNNQIVQVIRHVEFEDLGSFAAPLIQAGYSINYLDAAACDLRSVDPLGAGILVILGGPIAAYDHASYPVVHHEIELLRVRLAADLPTLGVCLGAQLMAAALGSRVYPGERKEIGWETISLTSAGRAGILRALEGTPVLHWHGDTFDLPEDCDLLASTPACRQQAFARGPNVLGVQFHAEPIAARFERWLIGHACELAAAKIDIDTLRADAALFGPALESASRGMLEAWLKSLRKR